MMSLTMKTLDRICLAVVLTISLLCAYWVVNLGVKERKQIRQENEILSKKLKDLNLAETNLQHLKAILGNTRKELKTLNERIPETGKFGHFVKQVDALMKQRGIELVSLQPLPTVQEKRYTKIPVHLVVKGAFLDVYGLLRDLETMNRLVLIEKLTIKKDRLEEQCRVDVTASAFER